MDKQYINSLLEKGFNIMPINSDKTPMQGWKNYQDQKITSLDVFPRQSDFYAIITGFNDIECNDVDLKDLPKKKDRNDFNFDLIKMLISNIFFVF